MAPAVNGMLAEQIGRLEKVANTSKAEKIKGSIGHAAWHFLLFDGSHICPLLTLINSLAKSAAQDTTLA
jgi:hypothetical protein